MPTVVTRSAIGDLAPITTTETYDGDCVAATASNYGAFLYTVTYTRHPTTKRILSATHTLADL